MGLDSLIPVVYRSLFAKRDEDGNFTMPVIYKDHINGHGYGMQFIDELRAKKGPGFARVIKEHTTMSKYVQAQINDMCVTLKRHDRQIGEMI